METWELYKRYKRGLVSTEGYKRGLKVTVVADLAIGIAVTVLLTALYVNG